MESLIKLVKWIGIPFMALSGAIFYLLQKNQTLKQQLNNEKAGREMDGINNEIKEAKNEADKAEDDYRAAADDYQSSGDEPG